MQRAGGSTAHICKKEQPACTPQSVRFLGGFFVGAAFLNPTFPGIDSGSFFPTGLPTTRNGGAREHRHGPCSPGRTPGRGPGCSRCSRPAAVPATRPPTASPAPPKSRMSGAAQGSTFSVRCRQRRTTEGETGDGANVSLNRPLPPQQV